MKTQSIISKTLLVSLLFLSLISGISAQKDSIYVYRNGSILFKEATAKFDSLTFSSHANTNTLNLHVKGSVAFNRAVSEIDSVNFSTKVKMLALVTTSSAKATNAITAAATGVIENDGGSAITARGFCWSKTTKPTTANNKTNEGKGIGKITSTIAALEPETTYYVRAYATNATGTAYGQELSFTTNDGKVSLKTTTPNSVSDISATLGATISSDGGAPITTRGVCWGKTPNPTTTNSKMTNGQGVGSFTCSVKDLAPNTTYYARSYATNQAGTFYGEQVSFTTREAMSGKNWMCRVTDDTYLRHISIPGTHDSGSTKGGLIDISKCQDWDINTQLENGIRFFDIRFKVKDNKLKIYHGIDEMDLWHDEFFTIVTSFLSKQPTETVIISIKNENNSANDSERNTFNQLLEAHMTANSAKWFTEARIPKLSEARGKMVLFRRYDKSNRGINMSSWADNTTFDASGGRVQDVYSIKNTTDAQIDIKWTHIANLLDEAYKDKTEKGGSKFFVNFSSASVTLRKPSAISDKINPKLQTFMNSAAKGSWGWILMDFPTLNLVESIYKKNF